MQSNIKQELSARYTFEGKYPRLAIAFDFIGCVVAFAGVVFVVALLTVIIK